MEFFIAGGAQVYEQALPLCSDLYLTLVKREEEGDAFFPPFEDKFALIGRNSADDTRVQNPALPASVVDFTRSMSFVESLNN